MQGESGNIRKDRWVGAALFTGFLLLYLRTLCPTVYLGDSGEICTAIALGGVLHPPGYPLFSLLGRLALLLPFGEPAFRLGCLVAVAAAAAVAVLYGLGRALRCTPAAAAAGAAVFGASYTFWSQSVRVEVYSLHVLLVGLVLLAALRYRESGRTIDLAGVALAGSLGLAHHLSIVHLAPGVLVLCGRRLWRDPGLGQRVGVVSAVLGVGPALYGLLVIWARSGTMHAWGRPVTLELLWNHATARLYGSNLGLPGWEALGAGLGRAGSLLVDTLPGGLCLLPLVGLAILWRRDRAVAAGLALVAFAVGLFNLCYAVEDIAVFYLPVWAVVACLFAAAADRLAGFAAADPKRAALGGIILAVAAGVPLVRNWSACDLSRATWMREYARHKLLSTDRGGVLITEGDNDTFPIWYVRDVLGFRRDVVHIDRTLVDCVFLTYHLDPSLWYLHRLRGQGLPVPIPGASPQELAEWQQLGCDGYLIRLLEQELADRPLCTTFISIDTPLSHDPQVFLQWTRARFRASAQGMVFRQLPREQPATVSERLRQSERVWTEIAPPSLGRARTDQDVNPRLAAHYAGMLTNFGTLNAEAARLRHAEQIYRRALALAPGFRPAEEALAALERRRSAASGLPAAQP
jgi:hypothetical protein